MNEQTEDREALARDRRLLDAVKDVVESYRLTAGIPLTERLKWAAADYQVDEKALTAAVQVILNQRTNLMKVAVVGLGKLGAPMAALFGARGHEVIAIDQTPWVVEKMNARKPPWLEPGLGEMLQNSSGLKATLNYHDAVGAELVFLIVPTPSTDNGTFSTRMLVQAVKDLAPVLTLSPQPPVVVVVSTVNPGDTDTHLRPVLDKVAGRSVPVCYSPEFISLGEVLRTMQSPDYVLIGESDAVAGTKLARFYLTVTSNNPPIQRMSIVNAEIAKLATNTYITTKISYANMIGELCERVPGADAAIVARSIGLDHRIGLAYLTPAVGFGGPCFPRDARALIALAERYGTSVPICNATDEINRRQTNRLASMVMDLLPKDGHAAVLGLSYKPLTPVVEESPGLQLAQTLQAHNVNLTVYDPVAMDNARPFLPNVAFAASSSAAVKSADVVIIMTNWPEFADLKFPDRKMTVIDCWRQLLKAELPHNVRLITLGTNVI